MTTIITRTLLMVMCITCLAVPVQADGGEPAAFARGKGPRRTLELLADLQVDASASAGAAGAVKALKAQAQKLGAELLVDVVVEPMEVESPLSPVVALPAAALGALLSVLTLDPTPALEATGATVAPPLKRRVFRAHGVAARYVR